MLTALRRRSRVVASRFVRLSGSASVTPTNQGPKEVAAAEGSSEVVTPGQLAPMYRSERRLLSKNVPVLRKSLYQPRPLTFEDKAFLPWMTLMLTNTKWSQQIANAESVWRSIEEQATQNTWFEALNLERTFMTEHSLIALHVWILHKRFMLDFHNEGLLNGRVADRELFTTFWDDTNNRIRNVGVTELSVNKQLENIQKATFLDMMEYDQALRSNDDNMELSAALFKGVFQGDEEARVEDVIALADWTRNELLSVLTQPAEDVYRGWITWSPALGESREERLERQRSLFAGEWREEVQVDGKLTFWNTATREVRSGDDVPAEGLTHRRSFALASHLKLLADEGKIDRSLVNPSGLRSLHAIERGEPTESVVIPEDHRASQLDEGQDSPSSTAQIRG